jgi:hypothetical protein
MENKVIETKIDGLIEDLNPEKRILIYFDFNGRKRNWDNLQNILKDTIYANLPIKLKAFCCGSIKTIWKNKNFPSKDQKCKCGKCYLVKWKNYGKINPNKRRKEPKDLLLYSPARTGSSSG